MRLRRAPAALVVLGLVAVAGPTGWADPAVAGCVAPQLRTAGTTWADGTAPALRAEVRPGADLLVEGRAFRDGCDDYGGSSTLGCGPTVQEDVRPASDVVLRVEQGGRSWPLGDADADASYEVAWRVELPADLRPGRARLVADGSEPLRLRVVAGR